ncbi:hypothetical protein [Sinorhizobium medicae]|uniref:hypothetical protein n=1 Tax=Sinorhizobium medicae TaxID=110321 RepID=UPI0027DE6D12|nr:hypothetical protein [Sinorhizobium medicae]
MFGVRSGDKRISHFADLEIGGCGPWLSMMIGFSLIVEGFGFHIAKGYLYAAIGFSVPIESFNQIDRRNKERLVAAGDLRERTGDAVLRQLGGKRRSASVSTP